MRLTDEEVKTARFAVEWFIHDSNRAGRRISREVAQLRQHLNAAIDSSGSGSENCSRSDDPEGSRWIGSPLVAQMLDCSERWVRRLATQLGGEKIGGRWIFPEQAVIDYLEETACRTTQQARPSSRSSQT